MKLVICTQHNFDHVSYLNRILKRFQRAYFQQPKPFTSLDFLTRTNSYNSKVWDNVFLFYTSYFQGLSSNLYFEGSLLFQQVVIVAVVAVVAVVVAVLVVVIIVVLRNKSCLFMQWLINLCHTRALFPLVLVHFISCESRQCFGSFKTKRRLLSMA